jgi:phage tail tape-measure protein
VVVGLAVDAYNIYNSPCKIKATLEAAFGMLGALGLGSAGAALGAAAGGVGAVPLGIGGSMLGGYLGRKAADLIYDSFF